MCGRYTATKFGGENFDRYNGPFDPDPFAAAGVMRAVADRTDDMAGPVR